MTAVIACFDPPEALVEATRETLRQVDAVIAVDDGSACGATVFAALEALGVEVVHQPNAGIAGALNAGIRRVQADAPRPGSRPGSGPGADGGGGGASYVLTLDQDSRLEPGYVAAALDTARRLDEARVPWSFVAAESYSGHRAKTAGVVRVDSESSSSTHAATRVELDDSESTQPPELRRAFDPMQSGWLVPLTTFATMGLLEDDLVIDAVDSEFTVRCLEAGLAPVVAPGAHLVHGQGERVPGRLLGRDVGMVNRHSATRVHYLTRNGTLLTRRHLVTQPRWVLRRLVEEGKAHLLRLALDPDRARLARAVVLGWRDGLLGRTGRSGVSP